MGPPLKQKYYDNVVVKLWEKKKKVYETNLKDLGE